MSSVSFRNNDTYKLFSLSLFLSLSLSIYIYIYNMYEENVALNKPNGFIYHLAKTAHLTTLIRWLAISHITAVGDYTMLYYH